jgi:hypothetical protein
VTYKKVCKKINNVILKNSNKILVVLDNYKKGGLEKHSDILEKYLNANICVKNYSLRNDILTYSESILDDYNIILLQNIFFDISNINKNKKKIIYIVHSQCDWWSTDHKQIVINNYK